MNVTVNGEPRSVRSGTTVAGMIALLQVAPDARGIAVALDGEVVARSSWARTELSDGARVEVLAAIQGG